MSAKDRKTLVVGAISVGSVVALGKGVPWWREWDSEQRARASIVLARAAEFDRAMTALPVTMDSAKNATHRYSAATNALLVEGCVPRLVEIQARPRVMRLTPRRMWRS